MFWMIKPLALPFRCLGQHMGGIAAVAELMVNLGGDPVAIDAVSKAAQGEFGLGGHQRHCAALYAGAQRDDVKRLGHGTS